MFSGWDCSGQIRRSRSSSGKGFGHEGYISGASFSFALSDPPQIAEPLLTQAALSSAGHLHRARFARNSMHARDGFVFDWLAAFAELVLFDGSLCHEISHGPECAMRDRVEPCDANHLHAYLPRPEQSRALARSPLQTGVSRPALLSATAVRSSDALPRKSRSVLQLCVPEAAAQFPTSEGPLGWSYCSREYSCKITAIFNFMDLFS